MSKPRKWILIALAILGGLLAAGYAYAPWLIATIAARALSGVVEVRELEIQSVGLGRVEVAILRVNNKQVRIDAQHGTVRFELWPFRIQDVTIERARLELAAGPDDTGAGAAPALPPFPLKVGELALQIDTPWGPSSLSASIETSPGRFGGLEAEVRGAQLNATVANPAEHRHAMEIRQPGGTALLSLDARAEGGFPVDVDARSDPGPLVQWLQTSRIVPPQLRAVLAEYAVSGSELAATGSLEQNLDFEAVLRGDLEVTDQRAPAERLFDSAAIRSPAGYTVARTGTAWSGSGNADVRLVPDAGTTITGRNPEWLWDDLGASLVIVETRHDPLALHADTVRLTARGIGDPQMNGDLQLNGLRTANWPEPLTYYNINGNWSLANTAADAAWSAAGTGSSGSLPDLDWKLDAEGERGSIEIGVRDDAAALIPALQSFAGELAVGLEITSGALQGRYRLEWNAEHEQTVLEAGATSIDARLGETEIRGLSVRLENQGDDIETLDFLLSAPALRLAAGTTAEELELELRVSLPEVRINTLRARLFGGTVSLRPATVNLDDEEIVLFVDIDALSLEELMMLFELESTELTGEVAGPVRMVYNSQRGIEVNEAELHSTEPGVLRFRLGTQSEVATQVDNIALRALKNFEYDELNASVLYKPDGEYRIKARIVGNNPEVLDGHPIALNPTIEGRLPAVFRAFFITGDFNQAIIKRLQE